jgi:hypothetical protein
MSAGQARDCCSQFFAQLTKEDSSVTATAYALIATQIRRSPRRSPSEANCKISLCQRHNLSRRCDLEIAFATSMTAIILKSSNRAN